MEDKETTIYCRMLGHAVPFRYCLEPGNPVFCKNILSCWAATFDIESYLSEHYTKADIEYALKSKTTGKMVSLLSLIQQSQERMKET